LILLNDVWLVLISVLTIISPHVWAILI